MIEYNTDGSDTLTVLADAEPKETRTLKCEYTLSWWMMTVIGVRSFLRRIGVPLPYKSYQIRIKNGRLHFG